MKNINKKLEKGLNNLFETSLMKILDDKLDRIFEDNTLSEAQKTKALREVEKWVDKVVANLERK